MTDTPQVTWFAEHEADYQARLLAAYRLLRQAWDIAPTGNRKAIAEAMNDELAGMDEPTFKKTCGWAEARNRRQRKGKP